MNERIKVVVADDEDDFANLVRLVLTVEGFDVKVAVNGREALEKIKSFVPDLVILDVNMPYLTGFQVLEKLRYSEKFKNLPVIMLTVRNAENDELDGLEYGCDDYVTKPFMPNQLVARVRSVLRRSGKKLNGKT
ncbi:response regulator [bacterium]|nr:response regulator [bacterium]MBU3954919.1 response regulator [bacterium]MBU4134277.1 response regulator [bacterium]